MGQNIVIKERIPPQTLPGMRQTIHFPSTYVPGQYIAGTGNEVSFIFQGNTSGHGEALSQSNMFVITVTAPTHDPIIEGTNIPVYRISALLDGGMTISQVLEDFPSLTADQVVLARDYAMSYPNFGKQYPRKSLKRLLRHSGIYELDQELKGIK